MLNLENTVTIHIDWNNAKSIDLAEQAKARLENDGWQLINSFGGLDTSALIYAENN